MRGSTSVKIDRDANSAYNFKTLILCKNLDSLESEAAAEPPYLRRTRTILAVFLFEVLGVVGPPGCPLTAFLSLAHVSEVIGLLVAT